MLYFHRAYFMIADAFFLLLLFYFIFSRYVWPWECILDERQNVDKVVDTDGQFEVFGQFISPINRAIFFATKICCCCCCCSATFCPAFVFAVAIALRCLLLQTVHIYFVKIWFYGKRYRGAYLLSIFVNSMFVIILSIGTNKMIFILHEENVYGVCVCERVCSDFSHSSILHIRFHYCWYCRSCFCCCCYCCSNINIICLSVHTIVMFRLLILF